MSPALAAAAGRVVNRTYGRRVALHEAGHFLIAYLLGLLPRGYTLSSLDLFIRWADGLFGRQWLLLLSAAEREWGAVAYFLGLLPNS